MAKKFNEKPNWTFGIELELNCEVKVRGSFAFLTILDEHKNKVIEVSGDMGNENQRRVEISTLPIRLSQEAEHRDHMKLIQFLKNMFDDITQMDDHTMTKDQIKNEFKEFIDREDNMLSHRYTIEVLSQHLVIPSLPPVSVSTQQISFGVPITDVDYFLQDIDFNPHWYQTRKFVLEGATDEQQWKYNYTLCLMEYLISLFSQKKDITSPIVKNSWKVMPRNPVSELWDRGLQRELPLNHVLELFKGIYDPKDIREAYEYLSGGVPVGGKLSSIVRLENQIVFECRMIPSCLHEFYFY